MNLSNYRPSRKVGGRCRLLPQVLTARSPFFLERPREQPAYRLRSGGAIRKAKPRTGPDWVHEIKHDGYRLIVGRDRGTVRLFTRRGYDWTGRYPVIASTAAKLCASPRMQDLNVSVPRQCRLAAQSCSSGPPPS
jgi:hypothetical protein